MSDMPKDFMGIELIGEVSVSERVLSHSLDEGHLLSKIEAASMRAERSFLVKNKIDFQDVSQEQLLPFSKLISKSIKGVVERDCPWLKGRLTISAAMQKRETFFKIRVSLNGSQAHIERNLPQVFH